MRFETVREARLVIETYSVLTKTELHPDAVWRTFGKLALPALYELLNRLDDPEQRAELLTELHQIPQASEGKSTAAPVV
jgi:hypothetical protein